MLESISGAYARFIEIIDTPFWAPWVLLVGVGLLLLGGRWLVNGSVTLARRLGISTLIVGLTVVAFGTSAPELAFNIIAAVNGNTELSFGNVIGSNIANVGLVLGLSAMTAPLIIHHRVIGKELPWLVLISLGTILLALLPPDVVVGNQLQFGFARLDGWILLGVFLVFILMWYRMARRDVRAAPPLTEEAIPYSEHKSLPLAILLVLLGLTLLCAGGKGAEIGAVRLALMLHVEKDVIGLTIVAIATSLPEAIASITACRAGHSDLAVGNVIGSNLFNLLLVMGLTCVVQPVPIPAEGAWVDLAVMFGITLVLLPLAWRRGLRIGRMDGLALVICYLTFLGFRVVAALN